jgi:two-component sensor histidine kinase
MVNGTFPVKTFSYNENDLLITFSSNTFAEEESVQYQYILAQNGTGTWSPPAETHRIQYAALRPGKYSFEVKAVNNRGIPGIHKALFSFTILPPFWQTPWFIATVVVIIIGIVYLIYRARIRQLTVLQVMRNNISRNLHDDIGASLSNINILNALTLRHLDDTQKAESYLTQSSEDIQRISESLSDIVWNVNPMNDNLDQVYSHMKRYAADMLEGSNIIAEFDFPPEGSKLHLSMDKRRDFYLIFKEAINNMAKHSQATQATISIRENGNRLLLQIKDNGIGFDPGVVKSGNGLANMNARAQKWNSELIIRSRPEHGTMMEMHLST